MQNEESYKRICKKCSDSGYAMVYKAPRVLREYCDCETGKRSEAKIKEQINKRYDPVWELFKL